jgi:FKBP12-rapamycin complex-associated protein
MQFFGLVNTLLTADRSTVKQDLTIRRYEVIPLSPNSGLIEWVPYSDPLHHVIKQYRDARKILLNIEQRLMQKMAPDYASLMLIQKVEVFEYALHMTAGQDLAKVLWLRSPNAEVWLDRRTNFTRSLAVMSMVGYILGLGDRHTCNLMLDRNSGEIIHIDFGDCFEVAMHREKYPEKVPFRLTRMLVNAMEVSGVEGSFRFVCERVLRVLRKNRNSLMALLEAFIYDPLINWRLVDQRKIKPAQADDRPPDTRNQQQHQQPQLRQPQLQKTNSNDKSSTGSEVEPTSNAMVIQGGDPQSQSQNTANTPPNVDRRRSLIAGVDEVNAAPTEQPNEKALSVVARVESKLKGTDFMEDSSKSKSRDRTATAPAPAAPCVLDIPQQVQRLIEEATSHINLCQAYVGWCPFW